MRTSQLIYITLHSSSQSSNQFSMNQQAYHQSDHMIIAYHYNRTNPLLASDLICTHIIRKVRLRRW
jgi:hypothetical protein